jgi:hypothetical protein
MMICAKEILDEVRKCRERQGLQLKNTGIEVWIRQG